MLLKYETIRVLSKIYQNIHLLGGVTYIRRKRATLYSTTVAKSCIDALDLFTDILRFDRERLQLEKIVANVPSRVSKNKITENDEIFKNINFTDRRNAKVTLEKLLKKNKVDKNWGNIFRIIEICLSHNIPLELSAVQSLLEQFSSCGFLRGLLQLRVLLCTTFPDVYLSKGELLVELARCYWIVGNSNECFVRMNEFIAKYPNLKDSMREPMKKIIFEAVLNRSEAELKCTVSFIEKYTAQSNDLYLLVVLWNYLFLSDWFTDQNLADQLLQRFMALKPNIALMSSSLGRYFIKCNRIKDLHRLLELFLKYQMMDSYAIVIQILFDYHFRKGDQYACSEIVKSSVRLKTPLRDEQYNYFISWCATGDPFKCLPSSEIKQIYLKF